MDLLEKMKKHGEAVELLGRYSLSSLLVILDQITTFILVPSFSNLLCNTRSFYSVILSSMPSPQNSVIRFTSKKLTPSPFHKMKKSFFFSKGTATFYFNLVMIRISFEQRNCCEPIFCTGTGAPGGSGSAST